MRHNRSRSQAQTETQQLSYDRVYFPEHLFKRPHNDYETGECVILSEDSTSPDNLSGKNVSQSELLAPNMDFFTY